MTTADYIFLAFVVAAFVSYGVLLFSAWLAVEVLGPKTRPSTKAKTFEAPAVEAERPARAA